MRSWLAATATLGALCGAASPADAAVYDRADDCIDPRATPAALSLAEPGDGLHVLAEPGTGNEAGAVSVRADVLLGRPDRRMAELFTRGLGRTVGTPRTVGGGAYRIYVVPAIAPNTPAAVAPSCADPRQTAMLVARDWARDVDTPFFVAHEFGHVFQYAVSGRTLRGSWWLEATAEYAGRRIDPPFGDLGRDAAFLARPELSLDSRRDVHEYGAWRFVQWLDARMGDRRFWGMLRDSFDRHGVRESIEDDEDQPDTTRVVRRALQEAGRDLDVDLPRFWADHLRDTPDSGPAAARTTVRVSAGARTKSFSVRRLAARLLDLAPDAGIRRLRVRIDPPGDDRLYVTGPLRRVRTFDQIYCTEGGGRHPRLPADLAFAYTNVAADTQTLKVKLDASTDDAGCRRSTTTPTPAPPPDAAACGAKEGTYDTGTGGAVRVKLSVDCFRGRLTVNGITGKVPCSGQPVPLGTSADTYYLLRQEADEGDRLQTTYAPTSTASVTLDVRFAGSQASGTVRAVARNLLGEPVCTSDPETFVASTG